MGDMATEGHDTDAHVRAGAYGAHAPGCARCEERLTLPDFLLARIAEDEEAWRGSTEFRVRIDLTRVDMTMTERVLAECEAKRRVVDHAMRMGLTDYELAPLRLLAAVYADHPDYDPAWAPTA